MATPGIKCNARDDIMGIELNNIISAVSEYSHLSLEQSGGGIHKGTVSDDEIAEVPSMDCRVT